MTTIKLPIPILLLKTKSTPTDSYEQYFSAASAPLFTPIFVPVLEHRPNVQNLETVKSWLRDGVARGAGPKKRMMGKYGGMIFTSQRAVEAFATVVADLEEAEERENNSARSQCHPPPLPPPPPSPPSPSCPPIPIFPLYTVGPATSHSLRTLLSNSPTILQPLDPQILGSHTGNGAALANYILNQDPHPSTPGHPSPLLFLVGDQRRDIIPKTLMSPSLPSQQRIQVDELVVYETGVMTTFADDLDRALVHCQSQAGPTSGPRSADDDEKRTREPQLDSPNEPPAVVVVVIVIFSPAGCRETLHRLGLLPKSPGIINQTHPPPTIPTTHHPSPADDDDNNNNNTTTTTNPNPLPSSKNARAETSPTTTPTTTPVQPDPRSRFIITTIGPTTRDFLRTEFGFEADICAEKPCPEGVGEAVEAYLRERGMLFCEQG